MQFDTPLRYAEWFAERAATFPFVEPLLPQVSARGLGQGVEDYASVLVRSAGGVLGTIEVGNMNPRTGGDGEWKISGRDALLKVVDDRRMRIVTHDGDETIDVAEAAGAQPAWRPACCG